MAISFIKSISFSFAQENNTQGMEQDFKIEQQGDVLYIYQVKFASFYHAFHVFCIAVLHHAPGSQSRLHFQQVFIVREL